MAPGTTIDNETIVRCSNLLTVYTLCATNVRIAEDTKTGQKHGLPHLRIMKSSGDVNSTISSQFFLQRQNHFFQPYECKRDRPFDKYGLNIEDGSIVWKSVLTVVCDVFGTAYLIKGGYSNSS